MCSSHHILLGLARSSDALVWFDVVPPGGPGRNPAALHPTNRAVYIDHLERVIESASTKIHASLKGLCRRTARSRKCVEDLAHLFLRRKPEAREVAPDSRILGPW